MKLPFGWTSETVGQIISYAGVGLMALGVGIEYGTVGAIAVFALGLPILGIQQRMREQAHLNLLVLDALRSLEMAMQNQRISERLSLEVSRELHALLKRVAEEGITRE